MKKQECLFCRKHTLPCTHWFTFYIENPGGGATYSVYAPSYTTIAQVKRAHSAAANVTVDSFRLAFDGTRCQDHQTLQECGIGEGSRVCFIIMQWGD